MKSVGIESYSFYAPRYYLDLGDLAKARGVEASKYRVGIGQEQMGFPPPDEDVVTMAANAARVALEGIPVESVDSLIFATESGIDQSKAAGIYVHHLLGLSKHCKSFEVKQACCSSTAALQMALAFVAQKPDRRVLIVASDIARYGLGSAGEPTQGAAALAMVVSSQPRIIALEPEWGSYTEDVMDFWRPNYLEEALVDGKYSIKIYLKALTESWKQYSEESHRGLADHARFCYHLPFTRMADKAHRHLLKVCGEPDITDALVDRHIGESLVYNRVIGNSYTASLYVGLASLLEHAVDDLAGKRIGLFSYGSGCMAAYFSGVVQTGYRDHLHADWHRRMLADREALPIERYEAFYGHALPQDGRDYVTPRHKTGPYRLAGIRDHKRIYEKVRSQRSLPKKARIAEPAHAE